MGALQARTMANLEHSIRVLKSGHLDTGLTGTYFLTKLLTDEGRNDLIFEYANKTTYPSYGHFLKEGFTTWPEHWLSNVEKVVDFPISKMHGCYNGIGLWFIQGIAGIVVDASASDYPIQIRPGVESGDLSWASGYRYALTGVARSSWSLADGAFWHNVTIPGNAVARVMIPALHEDDVREGREPVQTATGVTVLGLQQFNGIQYLLLKVMSGEY